MKHKWNPETDPIGDKERIGRRCFDQPELVGANGQPSFAGLDYRHFEETGRDNQLSLDRLGSTGIDNRAKRYLQPRAVAHGAARVPPKKFFGWCHVKASVLAKGFSNLSFPVVASPDQEGDGLQKNIHHAHVVVDGDAKIAALCLREIFARQGGFETAEEPE